MPPPPIETIAQALPRIAADTRGRAIEQAVHRLGDLAHVFVDTCDRLTRACADVAAPTPGELLRLVRLAA